MVAALLVQFLLDALQQPERNWC